VIADDLCLRLFEVVPFDIPSHQKLSENSMDIVNPYEPGQSNLEPRPSNVELEHADRLTRLFAVLLDAGVFVVPGIVAAIAIPQFIAKGDTIGGFALIGGVVGIAAIAWLVYNLKLMHEHGQTFGKRLLGIKVVRTDGSRLDLLRWITHRILVIAVLGMIPVVGWIVSLADPLAIFRETRQCLHDQIADTMVVKI